MAPSELAECVQTWRKGYERLAEISMAQLMLLKEEAGSADLWARLKTLSDEKESVQAEMERLQSQLESEIGGESMRELFQQQIRATVESARLLTFEASRKVEWMMISTGEKIGSTRNHRKVFRAYSGFSRDDEISFYFDEKK